MVEQQRDEIREAVEINVRRMGGAVVGAEAIIYGGGESAGVAGGLHVNFGIADQEGLGRGGAEFAKNRLRAKGIGLFCFKAVAAIDGAEIFRQAEFLQYAHADAHRLVREDGHRERGEMLKRFRNTRISAGRIQFVLLVVREEKFQRALKFVLCSAAAQSAADK